MADPVSCVPPKKRTRVDHASTLDVQQKRAFDVAVTQRDHLFLTGAAGNGKTYTVKKIIDALQELGATVDLVAPTGIAAKSLGMGASTIHRYLAISQFNRDGDFYGRELLTRPWLKEFLKRVQKTNVLVVDEISMVSAKLFDDMDEAMRIARRRRNEPFGGVQMIILGDFCQLSPVNGEYAFKSRKWDALEAQRVVLSTSHRQAGDARFAQLLEHARFGELTDDDMALLRTRIVRPLPDPLTSTRLNYYNVGVDEKNTAILQTLDAATEQRYSMQLTFASKKKHRSADAAAKLRERAEKMMKKSLRVPETLVLRERARVMLLRNLDVARGLVNGSIGEVVRFEEANGMSFPVVNFEEYGECMITPHCFDFSEDVDFAGSVTQLPLTLAWAITIHKCQSLTLSSAIMDLRSSSVRGEGCAYTALSRVRDLASVVFVDVSRASFEANAECKEESRVDT